jgi:hypothetical protein
MTEKEAREEIKRLMKLFYQIRPYPEDRYQERNYLSYWPTRPWGTHNQDFRIDFNLRGRPDWWVRWVTPSDENHPPDQSKTWLEGKRGELSKKSFFNARSLEIEWQERQNPWVNLWIKVIDQKDPVKEIIKIFNESWKEMEYPECKDVIYPEIDKRLFDEPGEDMGIDEYITMLEKSGNIILTGAPGTGKTYLARKIAAKMIGISDAEFPQYGFVQFHPSYDYTDFVEGLRPTKPDVNGNIGFRRQDGIFKAFCKNAIKNLDKKFGNRSRLFCI